MKMDAEDAWLVRKEFDGSRSRGVVIAHLNFGFEADVLAHRCVGFRSGIEADPIHVVREKRFREALLARAKHNLANGGSQVDDIQRSAATDSMTRR